MAFGHPISQFQAIQFMLAEYVHRDPCGEAADPQSRVEV